MYFKLNQRPPETTQLTLTNITLTALATVYIKLGIKKLLARAAVLLSFLTKFPLFNSL
ncbi:hypothetical protein [Clostridium sporogenes]|uniref:hypothetical protein n=1 Tax=Clostridium sporogenes TaxID=1509 RepID=UPI0013D6D284|nr:hypothetical protein [Clostridium sporogenes]